MHRSVRFRGWKVWKYRNLEVCSPTLLQFHLFLLFFVHSQSFSRLKCRCGPGSPLFPLVCK